MTETFVSFLLDETGSMMSVKDDTIGGFNQYVETLKKEKKSDESIRFSLVKFDSNHHTVACKDMPIERVSPLTEDDYNPGAMTPLIDACMKIIRATEASAGDAKQVIVVIQTDGYENCSRSFTSKDLAAVVKEKSALGWLFMFLGADMDAFAQAGELGIAAINTLSYGKAFTGDAFVTASASSLRYTASGGSGMAAAFTPQERTSSGGVPLPTGSLVDDIDLTPAAESAYGDSTAHRSGDPSRSKNE